MSIPLLNFHRAFSQDGTLRKGYSVGTDGLIKNGQAIDRRVSLSYLCEDNYLSQSDLSQKYSNILKKWNQGLIGDLADQTVIEKLFEKLQPEDRRILAIYLKSIQDKTGIDEIEEKARYFVIAMNQAKKCGKLESVLFRDPCCIPPLMSLIENNNIQLADFLIGIEAPSKLIRALANSKDDCTNEVIDLLENSPRSAAIWVTHLVKKKVLKEFFAKHQTLLKFIITTNFDDFRSELIDCLQKSPVFLEKYLHKLIKIESKTIVRALLREAASSNLLEKENARFFLEIDDPKNLEHAWHLLRFKHLRWTLFIDIYRNHLSEVLKLIAEYPYWKIEHFRSELVKLGLPVHEFDVLCKGKWKKFVCYQYLLKRDHYVPYEKFMLWARTFFVDKPVDKTHPYYRIFFKTLEYLIKHPERTDDFLEITKLDPLITLRLIEADVDVRRLKTKWKRDCFLNTLSDRRYSIEQLKYLHKLLITQDEITCKKLISLQTEFPGLFLALLKLNNETKWHSNDLLVFLIAFAADHREICPEILALISQKQLYQGKDPQIKLNDVVSVLRIYKGDLGKIIQVFSPFYEVLKAFIEHGEYSLLIDLYDKHHVDQYARTRKVIDQTCRLIIAKRDEALKEIWKALAADQLELAEHLVDVAFGKTEQPKDKVSVLQTKLPPLFQENLEQVFSDFESFYATWFTHSEFYIQAETLLCEAVANLIIEHDGCVNTGVITYLLTETDVCKYWNQADTIAPRLFRALRLLQDNPEYIELIGSINQKQRWDKKFNSYMRKHSQLRENEPYPNVILKRQVLAAFLMQLRQTDIGTCFATSLAIQIQEKDPLQTLKDLKGIAETGLLSRNEARYALSLPNFIFDRKPCKSNRLLSAWDCTIVNMGSWDNFQWNKLASALNSVIKARMKKIDPTQTKSLIKLISEHVDQQFVYIFNPDQKVCNSIDGSSTKGAFVLHRLPPWSLELKPVTRLDDFMTIISDCFAGVLRITPSDTLEVLLKRIKKKHFEPYVTGDNNFLEISGSLVPSIGKNLLSMEFLEEDMNFYTEEDFFAYCLKTTRLFPQQAIVGYGNASHAFSMLSNHPSRVAYQAKENFLSDDVRLLPIEKYWKRVQVYLKKKLGNKLYFQLISVFGVVKDETIGKFFGRLPGMIELVTASEVETRRVMVGLETLMVNLPELRNGISIVHFFDTNWRIGKQNIHYGVGKSIVTGNLRVYEVAADGSEVKALSFAEFEEFTSCYFFR